MLIKFEEHVSKICNIVNKKLNALHRIASQIETEPIQTKYAFKKVFIESQFDKLLGKKCFFQYPSYKF